MKHNKTPTFKQVFNQLDEVIGCISEGDFMPEELQADAYKRTDKLWAMLEEIQKEYEALSI